MSFEKFKIKSNKKSIGITLDIEINKSLDKYLEKIKMSKSEYIEYLIEKDIKKAD